MRLKYRKFAVIGFRGVGKTSLLSQFVDHQFTEAYDPTLQSTYGKMIKVDGQLFRLELVDSAGEDEVPELSQDLCMNVDGWVFVYSITSAKSFDIVKNLHEQLEDKMGGMMKMPIVLVGNKLDLDKQRVVQKEDGEALSRLWGGDFVETSAKLNKNVSEIFSLAVRKHCLMDLPKRRRRFHSCLCF